MFEPQREKVKQQQISQIRSIEHWKWTMSKLLTNLRHMSTFMNFNNNENEAQQHKLFLLGLNVQAMTFDHDELPILFGKLIEEQTS